MASQHHRGWGGPQRQAQIGGRRGVYTRISQRLDQPVDAFEHLFVADRVGAVRMQRRCDEGDEDHW